MKVLPVKKAIELLEAVTFDYPLPENVKVHIKNMTPYLEKVYNKYSMEVEND